MNNSEYSGGIKRRLSPAELRKYKEQITSLAHEAEITNTLTVFDADLWNRVFNPHTSNIGQQIYESFSNHELLELIRKAEERCGNTPTKKDIFYVHMYYIKRRYSSFANALLECGYKSGGYLSEDSIRSLLRNASKAEAEAFSKYSVQRKSENTNTRPQRT